MSNNFYKGQYLIAEYDEFDNFVAVYDNLSELAVAYNRTVAQAQSMLLAHLKSKTKFFLIDLLYIGDDCFFDADVNTIRTMFPCP